MLLYFIVRNESSYPPPLYLPTHAYSSDCFSTICHPLIYRHPATLKHYPTFHFVSLTNKSAYSKSMNRARELTALFIEYIETASDEYKNILPQELRDVTLTLNIG